MIKRVWRAHVGSKAVQDRSAPKAMICIHAFGRPRKWRVGVPCGVGWLAGRPGCLVGCLVENGEREAVNCGRVASNKQGNYGCGQAPDWLAHDGGGARRRSRNCCGGRNRGAGQWERGAAAQQIMHGLVLAKGKVGVLGAWNRVVCGVVCRVLRCCCQRLFLARLPIEHALL